MSYQSQFCERMTSNIIYLSTFINHYSRIYQLLELFMSKLQYLPGQVIFVKEAHGKLRPAKVIRKSSYGTYKMKLYGAKDEDYISEYDIIEYSQQITEKMMNQTPKPNKKILKYLKSAEKDRIAFTENIPTQKAQNLIKQEQEQIEEGNITQQNGSKEVRTMYEAIINLKTSTILEDFRNGKLTNFHFYVEGSLVWHASNPKYLLMKKLEWALEDICLDFTNTILQRTIVEIMESDAIEVIEYIFSPIYNRLWSAIEAYKKNKNTKFKNYLISRKADTLLGFENYLNNPAVFLRAKKEFDDFLFGVNQAMNNKKKKKSWKTELHESYQQLAD